MATTPNSIISPQTVNATTLQFTASNGTVLADLFTAGSNGSVLHAISACGSHTTARLLTLKFYDGTNARFLGAMTIPISSGTTNAAPSVAVMLSSNFPWMPRDVNGNPFLMLKTGQKIQAVLDANTDSSTVIDLCAFGEDY